MARDALSLAHLVPSPPSVRIRPLVLQRTPTPGLAPGSGAPPRGLRLETSAFSPHRLLSYLENCVALSPPPNTAAHCLPPPREREGELPFPVAPTAPQSHARARAHRAHSRSTDRQAPPARTARTMWTIHVVRLGAPRRWTRRKHPSSPHPKGKTKATKNFKNRHRNRRGSYWRKCFSLIEGGERAKSDMKLRLYTDGR